VLSRRRDRRWIRIRRPVIMVGGELTLDGLELIYDRTNKIYEAPFQMKANGGMFLIDDFGRQQVRPRDLLNRWIVPMEKQIDFLSLHTGSKVEVPFEVLIVFSTNLPPRDLVDEAFLRRIRHKIEVTSPRLMATGKFLSGWPSGAVFLMMKRPLSIAARALHQEESKIAGQSSPRFVGPDYGYCCLSGCVAPL
jgi:predicted ATPase with chaperone activity